MALCYSRQGFSAACIRGTGFPQPRLPTCASFICVPHVWSPTASSCPGFSTAQILSNPGANPAVSNGQHDTAPGMSRRLQEIRQRGGKVILHRSAFQRNCPPGRPASVYKTGTDVLLAAGSAQWFLTKPKPPWSIGCVF